ncbi:MAG: hypothetical protein K2L07_04880 [Lachnospiraceae bacterium]|nr:hypothetical protein [Lachnospiraceae bacterium]
MFQTNKQIFIINGSGRVGKDSFCNLIRKYSGYNTYIISSVDDIKKKAQLMGWDGVSKTEKDRKFLSDLKDLCTWYNDAPYDYVRQQIMYFEATPSSEIMFIHIREPKEIEKIRQKYPYIKTILITNKNVPHITSNEADAGVFNYQYDYVIQNDGTLDELKNKVLCFINMLEGDNK